MSAAVVEHSASEEASVVRSLGMFIFFWLPQGSSHPAAGRHTGSATVLLGPEPWRVVPSTSQAENCGESPPLLSRFPQRQRREARGPLGRGTPGASGAERPHYPPADSEDHGPFRTSPEGGCRFRELGLVPFSPATRSVIRDPGPAVGRVGFMAVGKLTDPRSSSPLRGPWGPSLGRRPGPNCKNQYSAAAGINLAELDPDARRRSRSCGHCPSLRASRAAPFLGDGFKEPERLDKPCGPGNRKAQGTPSLCRLASNPPTPPTPSSPPPHPTPPTIPH